MRRTCPIESKRGGDFELSCALLNSGMAVPITGWQVDCWLRGPDGRLVQRLTVDMVDPNTRRYRPRALASRPCSRPVPLP